ncbi:MAG: hypothetical protein U0359_38990 [Byssovorax sp.]
MNQATEDIRKGLNEGLEEIEQVAGEIRVRLHLAGMDAKDAWRKLEPKLDEAKVHARSATAASRKALKDILDAFRDFHKTL